MRLKPALLCFYPAVTLFMMVDAAIIIVMVWNSLKIADSAFVMGMTLCVAAIIPHALERLLERKRALKRSVKRLAAIRLAALLGVLGLAWGDLGSSIEGFMAMAFMVGTIDYFTISTLEAKNVKLVLDGHVSSELSSRLMQTSIQIGAFSGSFIGGAVVDRFAVDTAVMLLATAGIVALTLCAFISDIGGADKAKTQVAACAYAAVAITPEVKKFIAALAMIGFHIGAFNCLVPIVYQKLNGWDATQFGLVGGLAGLGAFLGAFLPRIARSDHLYLALIVLADAAIVFSPQALAIYPCAFALGFSMNQLRIALRKKLIELADTEAMAGTIAARSSFYYLMLLGAAPLVLTALATERLLGLAAARVLMMVPALALAVAVLVLIKQSPAATSPMPSERS
jgi:hypothetical protein